MRWLSFNCRGLASPAKKLALRRLLDSKLIDIIYLQETLEKADQIIPVLQALKSGWIFHAHDVIGRSGGIALGINPRFIKINST